MNTICFAHDARLVTGSGFGTRMNALKKRLASLSGITLQSDIPEQDVATADLFVLVLEEPRVLNISLELIRMRCKALKPLRLYTPDLAIPQFLTAILDEARRAEYYAQAKIAEVTNRHPNEWEAYAYSFFPNPTLYRTEEDIFGSLECLIRRHRKAPEVTRLVC